MSDRQRTRTRRRRGAALGAAIGALLLAVGCGDAGSVSAGSSPGRTISCQDGADRWTARLSDDEPARLVDLDGPVDGAWTVATGADDEAPIAVGDEVEVEGAVRLVTPDHRCSLYVADLTSRTDGARPVLVVGDSLAHGLVADPARRAATDRIAAEAGLELVVDGQPGAPWLTERPDGVPLGRPGAGIGDELRGAASLPADVAVVTVLGANDAILAALVEEPGRTAWQAATDAAIDDGIGALSAGGRCVVVVTPPTGPIDQFSLEGNYTVQAERVASELRERPHVVDFGGAVDRLDAAEAWFGAADRLHPDRSGSRALAEMLVAELLTC